MIKAYIIDTITLKQYKGEDEYGTPSARTDVTVKARIDYGNRQVTNLAGEIIVSNAKILIEDRTIVRSSFNTRATSTIAYEDLINYDGVDHTIVQISKKKDFRTRHLEVYVA